MKWTLGILLGTITLPLFAADHIITKPDWVSDLSLSIKESYDDDVFLAGANSKDYPKSYVIPQGSVAAYKDKASWITTISPKVGVNFATLAKLDALQTFSLAYAPDFALYHQAASESYDAHRFVTQLKAGSKPFSISGENCFSYVDGSDFAPTYPGSLLSAWGIVAPRERRAQIQDKGSISVRYDFNHWFIRPAAAACFYNLLTKDMLRDGYLNFADRYDVNGGADVGFKVSKDFALVAGYRYGHQDQQQFTFTKYSSPSDYQRVLAGFEGKPFSWLEAKFLMGPDFRAYPVTTANHITPVNDRHPVKYYGEAALTATATPQDAFAFKYKQFEWVSSLGKVPYFDTCYELTYRRKLTDALTLDLGGKWLQADYRSGNLATCKRNDIQYSLSAALGYVVNKNLSLGLSYSRDIGRNAMENITRSGDRAFDRNLIALSGTLKF